VGEKGADGRKLLARGEYTALAIDENVQATVRDVYLVSRAENDHP
jgi:hypothetical protein